MPQVPPAEFIEEARDTLQLLKSADPAMLADQRKELREAHVGPGTEDFQRGYELGLQVARAMLAHSIKAIQAGCADIV